MLTHHSSQDYNVAASEAAKEARGKFEAEIERGRGRAIKVLEQVENDVPQDRIVPAKTIDFVTLNGIQVRYPDGNTESMHRHAVGQAASRSGMPLSYIDRLMDKKEPWANELVAENLRRLYHNGNADDTRYLTRSVRGEVRGFLSDSYRRLDARPIMEAFINAVQPFGAVPADGFALDTKVAIKFVLPYIFEPVPNEVMTFGVAYENSDFGDGAVSVRSFVNRLWCTNKAIGQEDLRKVHLGARLGTDIKFSERTYKLDTEAMASAVGDIVESTISPDRVHNFLDTIVEATKQKIDSNKMKEFIKANLRKDEGEAVIEAFNSPDVEMLPAGNNKWRFSNAISWIANSKIEDEGRKLEVMKIAGEALELKAA